MLEDTPVLEDYILSQRYASQCLLLAVAGATAHQQYTDVSLAHVILRSQIEAYAVLVSEDKVSCHIFPLTRTKETVV